MGTLKLHEGSLAALQLRLAGVPVTSSVGGGGNGNSPHHLHTFIALAHGLESLELCCVQYTWGFMCSMCSLNFKLIQQFFVKSIYKMYINPFTDLKDAYCPNVISVSVRIC